jgi:hypothetical protein
MDGVGPLYQRDYTARFADASCSPGQIAQLVRERFAELAPPDTAAFAVHADRESGLEVGDELDIRIALVGKCRVRVVHLDETSITLRTLRGHPEAGRITFGAAEDSDGRLVFKIRSRARSSGLLQRLGFFVMGKTMQARCWIRFIQRLADRCGGRIEGDIQVRTTRIENARSDGRGCDEPTFTRGDLG